MRYDQTVHLIKESQSDDDDEMDYRPHTDVKTVKANVKRTNITFGNGNMYDVTIVRVFGEVEADKIGLNDYDPNNQSTLHEIQKVGRHFQRTDFYIVNSKVVFGNG